MTRAQERNLIGELARFDAAFVAQELSIEQGLYLLKRTKADCSIPGLRLMSLATFSRVCRLARTLGAIRWRGRPHSRRGREYRGQMLLPLEACHG